MMEHTTDRLFWTLTSVIIGALLLTIGINAFPQMTKNVLKPVSGIMKQTDTTTGYANDAANKVLNDNTSSQTGDSAQDSPANNPNMSGITPSTTSNQNDPDAQAKENATNIDNVDNISVQDDGDGTGTLTNLSLTDSDNASFQNNKLTNNLYYNIPEYVTKNGKLLKITSLANGSLNNVTKPTYTANPSPSDNTPSININIPDSIKASTWNVNAFNENKPLTNGYATLNVTMSNQEANAIIPNWDTLKTQNQTPPIMSTITNQFPGNVYINGTQNGSFLNFGFAG